jgi:hypothetical protein
MTVRCVWPRHVLVYHLVLIAISKLAPAGCCLCCKLTRAPFPCEEGRGYCAEPLLGRSAGIPQRQFSIRGRPVRIPAQICASCRWPLVDTVPLWCPWSFLDRFARFFRELNCEASLKRTRRLLKLQNLAESFPEGSCPCKVCIGGGREFNPPKSRPPDLQYKGTVVLVDRPALTLGEYRLQRGATADERD